MSAYRELQEKIAKLQAQADELQAQAEEERLAVIAEIKQKIEDYEISLEDLDLLPSADAEPEPTYADKKVSQPFITKYQNLRTGRRGRPPKL